ncbi:MAG: hypothetical protein EZS28_027764, partial [Streblomastix strix]
MNISVNTGTDEYIVRTCTFTNCLNGAIYVALSNGGKASVINTQITGCQKNGDGGAIEAFIQSGGILTIDAQCRFTECTAQDSGGGISADITGENSKLIIGDGVLFDTCSCSRYNSSFISAQSHQLFNLLDPQLMSGNDYAIKTDMQDTADITSNYGGGLFAQNQNGGIMTIIGIPFIQCISYMFPYTVSSFGTGDGGGLYAVVGSLSNILTLIDLTFTNCNASGLGGGLYIQSTYGASAYLTRNFEFINCTSNQGGGIYVNSNSFISLLDVEMNIFNCSAKYTGGGMQLSAGQGEINVTGVINITDCNITGNDGQGSGGCISLNYPPFSNSQFLIDGNINIKNCNPNTEYQGVKKIGISAS